MISTQIPPKAPAPRVRACRAKPIVEATDDEADEARAVCARDARAIAKHLADIEKHHGANACWP